MPWKRLRRLSLRSSLSLLLLPALLLVVLVNLRMTGQDAVEAADAAYDRSLLGALKSIDANISTASGGLSVELPYRMFEFFELTASGAVYFRVATSDGLVELGSADLPMPAAGVGSTPVFYDAEYFGEAVRLVAYQRKLERPLAQSTSNALLIQVGESTQSRQQFTSRFVQRAVARDALVLLAMLVCAALAVTIALRPLAVLADQVRARKADDLTPLPANGLPADIHPLVTAVNQQMQRTQTLVSQQREFLDDASHQLRTHLTTLQLQVGYALKEQDPGQVRGALEAIRKELGEASRSTHQLLTLARSDTAPLAPAEVDLAGLIRDVVMDLMPRARAGQIDLG
ncbi:MAG: sensor histidine kinase, partial [Haliea sp.]